MFSETCILDDELNFCFSVALTHFDFNACLDVAKNAAEKYVIRNYDAQDFPSLVSESLAKINYHKGSDTLEPSLLQAVCSLSEHLPHVLDSIVLHDVVDNVAIVSHTPLLISGCPVFNNNTFSIAITRVPVLSLVALLCLRPESLATVLKNEKVRASVDSNAQFRKAFLTGEEP